MDFFGINLKTNVTSKDVSDLLIENNEVSGTIALKSIDSGSVSRFLLKGNPDGSLDLYYDGALVAQTTSAGITGAVWG